jgi:hypothetical protein
MNAECTWIKWISHGQNPVMIRLSRSIHNTERVLKPLLGAVVPNSQREPWEMAPEFLSPARGERNWWQ